MLLRGWNRLVATDMGNRTAKMMGLEKAPYTQEFSAGLIVKLVSVSSLLSIMTTLFLTRSLLVEIRGFLRIWELWRLMILD